MSESFKMECVSEKTNQVCRGETDDDPGKYVIITII